MMDKLQSWWRGISAREQRLVAVGGSVLLIGLFYWAIWQPVANRIAERERQVVNQQQTLALAQQNAAQSLRLDELQAALVRSETENRASAERAAVLQSRLDQSADRLSQLELSLRQAQAAGDEERRQRLLSIDTARVVERELAGEKEKRKAADALARTLEKYLDEEKTRAAALQSALTDAQRQPEAVATEPAKPSQPRLKPSRRSASVAVPVRRKTLR